MLNIFKGNNLTFVQIVLLKVPEHLLGSQPFFYSKLKDHNKSGINHVEKKVHLLKPTSYQ